MNLFTILNANNYFSVNRDIAKKIGIYAAIFLSELVDKYSYFESKGMLDDGWFYLTVEDAEDRTALGKDAQQTAIKKFEELGFVECMRRGIPAKRFFKLNKQKIHDWILGLSPLDQDGGMPPTRWRDASNKNIGTPTNCTEGFLPTAPIYKIQKEETKENTDIPFGLYVCLTSVEYEGLCKVHGSPLVDEMISSINDYISSKGIKPYKDYAATIRNWIRRRGNVSQAPQKQNNLSPRHTGLNKDDRPSNPGKIIDFSED